MKIENIYLSKEGKIMDNLDVTFKTPKELKKKLPEKYRKEIGIVISGRSEIRPMLFFLKKCMEDGFRENGASALIDFSPHLTK